MMQSWYEEVHCGTDRWRAGWRSSLMSLWTKHSSSFITDHSSVSCRCATVYVYCVCTVLYCIFTVCTRQVCCYLWLPCRRPYTPLCSGSCSCLVYSLRRQTADSCHWLRCSTSEETQLDTDRPSPESDSTLRERRSINTGSQVNTVSAGV